MNLFDSISPIDFRYYGRNEQIREKLAPYLSEEAAIKVEESCSHWEKELGL
jgi:hypothetical protein